MHPFFTTTLSLPEKRRERRSFCVAAESRSASRTLRRNSANILSSPSVSVSIIGSSPRPEPQNLTFRLWHGGISRVNKIIALGILLKYMYSFENTHPPT